MFMYFLKEALLLNQRVFLFSDCYLFRKLKINNKRKKHHPTSYSIEIMAFIISKRSILKMVSSFLHNLCFPLSVQ